MNNSIEDALIDLVVFIGLWPTRHSAEIENSNNNSKIYM